MKLQVINPYIHKIMACKALIFLILIANGLTQPLPSEPPSVGEFITHLEDRIPHLMNRYDIPGTAVALIRDGEPTWSQDYGYTDREQSQPITPKTWFRAESMTKSLTARAVMILVEQGKVDLDDPVEQHLSRWKFPETEFDTKQITIRRVLSHCAGLGFSIFDKIELEDHSRPAESVLNKLAHQKSLIVQQPGEGFLYSNPGYVLLELLIEDVSGTSYIEFVEDNLLQPLGMQASGFTLTSEITENAVTGYLFDGQSVPLNSEIVYAHGGLITTVDDFSRFAAAGIPGGDKNEILSREAFNQMYSSTIETEGFYALGSDAAGLGHFLEINEEGHKMISHGGQGAGWLAFYYLIPATGDGIIIFTNSEQSWRMVADILEYWAGWLGNSAPALSQSISRIATGIWLLTAVIGIGALVYLGRIFFQWKTKSHDFEKTTSPRNTYFKILKVVLALGLLFLTWQISGFYMISGIFPVISGWLMISMILLSVVMLADVFFGNLSGEFITRKIN